MDPQPLIRSARSPPTIPHYPGLTTVPIDKFVGSQQHSSPNRHSKDLSAQIFQLPLINKVIPHLTQIRNKKESEGSKTIEGSIFSNDNESFYGLPVGRFSKVGKGVVNVHERSFFEDDETVSVTGTMISDIRPDGLVHVQRAMPNGSPQERLLIHGHRDDRGEYMGHYFFHTSLHNRTDHRQKQSCLIDSAVVSLAKRSATMRRTELSDVQSVTATHAVREDNPAKRHASAVHRPVSMHVKIRDIGENNSDRLLDHHQNIETLAAAPPPAPVTLPSHQHRVYPSAPQDPNKLAIHNKEWYLAFATKAKGVPMYANLSCGKRFSQLRAGMKVENGVLVRDVPIDSLNLSIVLHSIYQGSEKLFEVQHRKAGHSRGILLNNQKSGIATWKLSPLNGILHRRNYSIYTRNAQDNDNSSHQRAVSMQSDHPKKLWTRVGAINHTSRNPLARFEILWSDCVRVILTGDVPGYAYRFIDFHTSEILGIFMLREDSFPETWDLMLLSQSLETQQQPHATPPHHLPHIHTKRISTKNGLPSIPYEVFVAGALVIQQLRGIMQPPVSAAAEGELRLPTAGPWDPAISNKGRKLRGENAVSNVERAGPTRDTVVEMSTMDKALNMRPLVTLRNLNY